MKDILCDKCKSKIGTIDDDAYVCSFDPYVGVEMYCSKCKEKTFLMGNKSTNHLLDI